MQIFPKTDEIRLSRMARLMKQEQLSKIAGVCHKTISNIEQGNPVKMETAAKISTALGKPFDQLFEIRQGE